MTQDEILKELKAGKYRPVYMLMGEETYPIDVISDYIEEHALNETERTFNQTVVYGHDVTGAQIAQECSQYPTFATRRVVIVKEAQGLNTKANGGANAAQGLRELEAYTEKPMETTVLVLCYKYKNADKRIKTLKNIEKNGAVMESKHLYDNQMPSWISTFANQQGLGIEGEAINLLLEACGTDMSKVASAFAKMKTAVGETKVITANMVSEHVGISKEYNAFELCNALFERNAPKAYKIAKIFGQNEKTYSAPGVLAALFSSFQKLFNYTFILQTTRDAQKAMSAVGGSAFMVNKTYAPAAQKYNATQCMAILGIINQYDMRSKGFEWPDTSHRDMMVDIVTRILNA